MQPKFKTLLAFEGKSRIFFRLHLAISCAKMQPFCKDATYFRFFSFKLNMPKDLTRHLSITLNHEA